MIGIGTNKWIAAWAGLSFCLVSVQAEENVQSATSADREQILRWVGDLSAATFQQREHAFINCGMLARTPKFTSAKRLNSGMRRYACVLG
ncbi:MAG: hypothetical protein R3C05_13565 [Pirellulaceae bacterium]